jgi:hypothetical protein
MKVPSLRHSFDRIGRYRIGVLLLMPLLVMAIFRVLVEDNNPSWRLILFWAGSLILIWAVIMDAWHVYSAKRKMRKLMDEATKPRHRRRDKI